MQVDSDYKKHPWVTGLNMGIILEISLDQLTIKSIPIGPSMGSSVSKISENILQNWKDTKIFDYPDGIKHAVQRIEINKNIGILVSLYFHQGVWQVSTMGDPDGTETMSWKEISLKISVRDNFWKTWKKNSYQFPPSENWSEKKFFLNCNDSIYSCYTFIFVSPHHRFGVLYEDAALFCVGVRNLSTLQEENFVKISVHSSFFAFFLNFPSAGKWMGNSNRIFF